MTKDQKPIPEVPDEYLTWPGKYEGKPKPPIIWAEQPTSNPLRALLFEAMRAIDDQALRERIALVLSATDETTACPDCGETGVPGLCPYCAADKS